MNILQVVRRFGPVGGMERYVWELTRELAAMGHHVQVLCEVDLSNGALPDIQIHTLGEVRPKPRWLAHIRFSNRVREWLKLHPQTDTIIHSHERLQGHHITTFHGPPFANIYSQPIWKRLSLRTTMNLWLERRELCSVGVQAIVPNSIRIADELAPYYPSIKEKLSEPIVPGVEKTPQRNIQEIATDAGTIGFVGKEWKRKGLAMAINIVSKLAETRPNLTFLVAGPAAQDIQHLFKSASFKYELLGETDARELYQQLDLLLHPARQEPFGMVITEALSAGVPAVISDVCGAASEITPSNGTLLSLNDPIKAWAEAIHLHLSNSGDQVTYDRSWHQVAVEYENTYQRLQL